MSTFVFICRRSLGSMTQYEKNSALTDYESFTPVGIDGIMVYERKKNCFSFHSILCALYTAIATIENVFYFIFFVERDAINSLKFLCCHLFHAYEKKSFTLVGRAKNPLKF